MEGGGRKSDFQKIFLLYWKILAPLVGVFCTHLDPPKRNVSTTNENLRGLWDLQNVYPQSRGPINLAPIPSMRLNEVFITRDVGYHQALDSPARLDHPAFCSAIIIYIYI